MIKLAKTISIIFFISSCSSVSYSELVPLIRTAVIGSPDIEISKDYVDKKEYSFARMRLGRSATAILTLSRIENNIFTWVSGNNEKIYTYNGKVIKVEGLAHNFESYNFKLFDLQILLNREIYSHQVDIFFTNPDAFVSQNVSLQVQKLDSNIVKIIENTNTDGFRWSVTNEYWIDSHSKLPVKSHQYIHPHLPMIKIDYYFK
jgi:hypothetical protein